MVTLNKLIAKSRTTEVDTVSDRIIKEYEKDDWSSDLHLTGIFNRLKPASLRLTKSINRIKAESMLEEKDEIRDQNVRSIYYLIHGFLHHPEETISNAARQLLDLFENYGLEIIKESYATESSLVESMLEDFAESKAEPAIAVLPGLSQLIYELRTAQTAFEEAKVIFEEEKAKEGTEETATEIKKEVVSLINDELVVYLRAMVQVNETVYGHFTRTVGEIIESNNITVRKRSNKHEGIETGGVN